MQLAANTLALSALLEDGVFPWSSGPIGSHAGFGLAKLADRDALAAYLAEREECELFISRYVDYSGPDGKFRKYRIVIIDGKSHACHMAIADEWKVWYLNADMALSVRHRLEEAMFMETFDRDFAACHAGALAELSPPHVVWITSPLIVRKPKRVLFSVFTRRTTPPLCMTWIRPTSIPTNRLRCRRSSKPCRQCSIAGQGAFARMPRDQLPRNRHLT